MSDNSHVPTASFRNPSTKRLAIALGTATLAFLSACTVMPKAITSSEQGAILAADRAAALKGVEPLAGDLTLAEAIARALKYNLDQRSRLMEVAVASGQYDLSRFDLLPRLAGTAGYGWRSNERITRSQDSVTGLPSLANPYISSDRNHTFEDLGLTWNVLDFGVSYINARQNGDRLFVATERRRKAMHVLMQDVRSAYWRAASAQKLEGDLNETIRLAETALSDSRRIESEQIRDPLEALRFQRTLLDNLRVLESIQRELGAARIELAALINLPVGQPFRLAEPAEADLMPVRNALPVERMEELALAGNADLKEQLYNTRIAVAETRKSLLRLFPSLSFTSTARHDSDSYLINNDWQEAGAQLSVNLFNLLSAPSMLRFNAASRELATQRRMATQMAVLAQVHLSRQQYEAAYALFERADAIWKVDQRIDAQTANRSAVEARGQLERISNNTAAIVSLLRRYQALNQVYAAQGRMQATIGTDPVVADVQATPLADLTRAIASAERGQSR